MGRIRPRRTSGPSELPLALRVKLCGHLTSRLYYQVARGVRIQVLAATQTYRYVLSYASSPTVPLAEADDGTDTQFFFNPNVDASTHVGAVPVPVEERSCPLVPAEALGMSAPEN